MSELVKQINDLLLTDTVKNSLTFEAFNFVQGLSDKVKGLERALEEMRKEKESYAEQYTKQNEENRRLISEIKTLDSALTSIKQKEHDYLKNEISMQYEKKRGDELFQIISMQCKLPGISLAKQSYDSAYPYPSSHYIATKNVSETTTITEE